MVATPVESWSGAISDLTNQRELTQAQARSVMELILAGEESEAQISEFLSLHTKKGGTANEVAGFIEAMYQHCAPISISGRAVDTVGTGGDGFHTINISTTSAIVAASAGARVVKHGNRAATSKSGAADVLEALGIKIDLHGEQIAQLVNELNIGFCFAPIFHSAMRYAASARKSLGYPTIFNVLGPLSNPAKPSSYAIGVAREDMFPLVAQVLCSRGVDALVFRGRDGLDEITLATTTDLFVIGAGRSFQTVINPEIWGIGPSPVESLRGGSAQENAQHLRDIVSGKKGAMRDVVLLNAAATLVAFDGVTEMLDTREIDSQFISALERASAAIDTGSASDLLERWALSSHQV